MWHLIWSAVATPAPTQSVTLPLVLAVISVAGVIGAGVITVLHRESSSAPRKLPDRVTELEEEAERNRQGHARLHARIDEIAENVHTNEYRSQTLDRQNAAQGERITRLERHDRGD